MNTLVVDCGGTGIKSAILNDDGAVTAGPVRVPTPYPLPPTLLAATIYQIGVELGGSFERATIGMPGMIRDGVVVYTPHYITVSGPHSAVDPQLASLWDHLDFGQLASEWLGVPVRVLNDAELHGFGVITGSGLELVLTFGTGLGSAWYYDGELAPHLEISHAPVRIQVMTPGVGRPHPVTFDQYIGDRALREVGVDHWSDRVLVIVESLWPVFRWDRLYLGGGNAGKIAPWALGRLPETVQVVPNEAALTGGAHVWVP
ncbi:MAG: ROK family protein [Promicromonosporaceae bacterium]|nr:ROK family protein [Promicromonosporaceae bacterium]